MIWACSIHHYVLTSVPTPSLSPVMPHFCRHMSGKEVKEKSAYFALLLIFFEARGHKNVPLFLRITSKKQIIHSLMGFGPQRQEGNTLANTNHTPLRQQQLVLGRMNGRTFKQSGWAEKRRNDCLLNSAFATMKICTSIRPEVYLLRV